MTKNIIRLLLADDSADDAETLSESLRRAGYVLKTQRVEDMAALDAALANAIWDVVLCKHSLPRLKINDVVAVINKRHAACVPLLVAKSLSAAEIRQSMEAGARDVFVMDDWGRLGPAIEREIDTSRARIAHAETAEMLRQLETRYRVMTESSKEAVAYCHDGVYVDANPVYLEMVGCADIDALRTIPVLNLINKNDHARFRNWLRKPGTHDGAQEFLALASDGREFAADISLSPINIGGEECVQIFVRDISERKALENKLQYLHQRDALTGIYSRHYFLQELGKRMERMTGGDTSRILVGIELQRLKDLNQKVGHAASDRLLMTITRHIREHAGNDYVLARTGGGQFALLLGANSDEGYRRIVENLRLGIASMRLKDRGKEIRLDFTLNQTVIDGSATDREKILNSLFSVETPKEPNPAIAENRPGPLTAAPATDRVARSSRATGSPAQSGRQVADLVSSALTNNTLRLLFQPIINLHGEPREFFEVRPTVFTIDGEPLPAEHMVPVAADAGLANKVNRWIMQQTIDHLARHKDRATAFFVSLSEMALTDKILLHAVQQHLTAIAVDAGRIHIQLPSLAVHKHNSAARAFIEEAGKIGLNIVIDSIDKRVISIDELKGIDAAYFAIDCRASLTGGDGSANTDELRHAVGMAKELGIATIARNVENADSFSVLWGVGVDYIQGDYLAPPLASPDHNFSEEQTLSSDMALPAFNWQAAG